MKTALVCSMAVAALSAGLISGPARADDMAAGGNTFEVRLRGIYLLPANQSDAIGALGVPSNEVHINNKWLPDLDGEYFFTPNWSTELILTYPQSQTVTVAGTPIGTFHHLPPVLTAKYNFLPGQDFQPYVGIGINLTIISDVNLAIPGVGKLDLNSTSVGFAGQFGFDYKLGNGWYANADVKWAQIGSDVNLVGVGKVTTVHVNPWLFGLGIGYRF